MTTHKLTSGIKTHLTAHEIESIADQLYQSEDWRSVASRIMAKKPRNLSDKVRSDRSKAMIEINKARKLKAIGLPH